MFSAKEATKEKIATYVASLEREKAGYEARINGLDAGNHDRLTKEQLEVRVTAVDAEIARVKKTGSKAKAEKAEKAD